MLSDVVDKEVVEEDVHDELVKKVNVIDTSALIIKQIMMLRSMGINVRYLVLLAEVLLPLLMLLIINYLTSVI